MKKILLFIVFMLLSIPCFAGYNVCHDGTGKNLRVTGSNPIKDVNCMYFYDGDIDEYNRVKTLYKNVGLKYLEVVDGKVVEMTQAEKDAIVQAEEDVQLAQQIITVEDMNISIKDAFRAWLTVYNSKVPLQYNVTAVELINQVKKDKGL